VRVVRITHTPLSPALGAMASLASRVPAPGARRVVPRARANGRRAARASAADTERLGPRDASTRPEVSVSRTGIFLRLSRARRVDD
jgi:hypothetical protein